jgi:hypothetical protein
MERRSFIRYGERMDGVQIRPSEKEAFWEASCACDDLGVVRRMVVVEARPLPEGLG